jgi:hypothetical protein
MSPVRLAALASIAALGFAAVGCSSSSSPSASTTPAVSASSSPSVVPVPPGRAVETAPTLSRSDVADDGLASHVGDGKLSTAEVRALMQYFENKVSAAYADGDADALDHYLTGQLLSGNRATINVLSGQHKLNIFRIQVGKVTIEKYEKNRVIFDMGGGMVIDYFVDSKTHKVLDNGLPGPSQARFEMYFTENPKTRTWYWTGEKSIEQKT